MDLTSFINDKRWADKLSRSGFFFGAVLLHLIIFVMVATWVIFPAFHPPTDEFTKDYLPPAAPPPPPPPANQPAVQVPTHVVTPPTAVISTPTAAPTFSVPLPDISAAQPDNTDTKMTTQIKPSTQSLSPQRLAKISQTVKGWRSDSPAESSSDPHNIQAKFPVYLASYLDGDWACNNYLDPDGKIVMGALPNLVAKINEWSKGKINGEVVPTPLNIGGPDLMDKKPPFVFFTGHKDFHLTDQEVQNLQDYLQVGGAIWGDATLAGKGSRFDVAFRREMKRVIPDVDKNFEDYPETSDIYTKSWFTLEKTPLGMNYYSEPIQHIDIDGKLAILYTLNDYGDMFTMRVLPGDATIQGDLPDVKSKSPLYSHPAFLYNRNIFFRNYEMESVTACNQLGLNIIGYLLVRFDKDLLLSP